LRDFARAGVVLFKRSGLDWTNRMSAIAADVSRLLIGNLVIDGAIISADTDGLNPHQSSGAIGNLCGPTLESAACNTLLRSRMAETEPPNISIH
jgi:hypothetical protein